ncbi:MAG TPA: molybdopterin cofactor-binding domain-containing protein, partial [Rhizomicrobium sp.]|nr:molybdopterin cofactor-binding domain-containing protein [Rhizomicrobium sp.]
RADRNTPGSMRSPPETPYLFALESAMDELAYEAGIDPVELRKRNDTKKEPIEGHTFTSRSLVECFDQGAKAFGWTLRNPKARTMRDGDWLVGLGTAATMYPSNIASAAARVTLYPDNSAKVACATHELGQGIFTACALIAAHKLGIDPARVTVELGDSRLPPAPVAGGSNTTASVGNAIAKACEEILAKRKSGVNDVIEAYADNTPTGAPKNDLDKLYRGKPAFSEGAEGTISYAFGAQFVEVRVHRLTGEIRVPRALGAFAAGTIVNPKTAESQLMGGIVWGISAALHEETEIDHGSARYYNDDLAEYLIPVNADIGDIKVLMLPEKEAFFNPLGIKGIGELGNVGMSAAVANAVYHATGIRVRRIPIRLEMLLAGLDPI